MAAIADAVQRGAHRHAVHVGQRIGLVEREHARPHAGAHQRVAEAAAFLVGPVHQFQRRLGGDAEVVQAADHLQARQHAQRPVEFATARLAVEVAAEQHRQSVGIAAGTAGEHVADRIDTHGEAGGLALGAEAVAAALVHVGERQAAHAALRRGADLRHRHQQVPQPLAVDALVGLGAGEDTISGSYFIDAHGTADAGGCSVRCVRPADSASHDQRSLAVRMSSFRALSNVGGAVWLPLAIVTQFWHGRPGSSIDAAYRRIPAWWQAEAAHRNPPLALLVQPAADPLSSWPAFGAVIQSPATVMAGLVPAICPTTGAA